MTNVKPSSKPSSFGSRLREERDRLQLSQAELASTGGVARTTQHIYEADVRAPDVDYLEAVRQVGVDVVYLLLGERRVQTSKGMLVLSREALARIFEFVLEAGRDADGDPFPMERLQDMFLTLCAFCSSAQGEKADPKALWSSLGQSTGT